MTFHGWARTRDWRLYAAIAAACIGVMGLVGIINAVNVGSGRYSTITKLAGGQRDLRAQNRQLIEMVENASAQNAQLIDQVNALENLVRSYGGDPGVVTTTSFPGRPSVSRSTTTATRPATTPTTTRATPTTSPQVAPQTTTTTRPTTTTTRPLGALCPPVCL